MTAIGIGFEWHSGHPRGYGWGSALPSGTAQPALPLAEALGRCNPDQRARSPALAKEDVLYATRPKPPAQLIRATRSLHGIFGCPEEAFDPQMLLDPFEEQFDLPAAFVECADGGSRQPELIGEEYQLLSRFGVPEADAPQVFGVMLAGVVTVQRDGLIANDAGGGVCGGGIDPM